MLQSKAHLYPEKDQLISLSAMPLIHPTRLEVMRQLSIEGPLSVQQLAKGHPLTKPAFSQHLDLLRKKDVVNYTVYHPYIIYELDVQRFQEACNNVLTYFHEIQSGWALPEKLILNM